MRTENDGVKCNRCGIIIHKDVIVSAFSRDLLQEVLESNKKPTMIIRMIDPTDSFPPPVILEERFGDDTHLKGNRENGNGFYFNRGYLMEGKENLVKLLQADHRTDASDTIVYFSFYR